MTNQQSIPDKKSILITGCSSGIGHYVAQALQQRGYRVFATARNPNDVAALEATGLESFQLDLQDSASLHAAVDAILQRTNNRLDALFNNGGFGLPGAIEDLTRENLRYQFETNLFGTIELTNRVIPVMREQGHGRIIQNSSILGFISPPFRGAYNSSKFALEGIYDALRIELQNSGIQVVLIQPGPIDSHFRHNALVEFEQHVDVSASVHREKYNRMIERLKKDGPTTQFTLPPSAVYKKVLKALELQNPRPRYSVTFPTVLFRFLKRILSDRALDKILARFV